MGEPKSLSRQVQEVSSQVLTHSLKQGEECGAGTGRKAEARLLLSSSSGTSAGGARGRLRGSPGEGRMFCVSWAATHGSGQPSWATPGPGKGSAKIWVAGGPPLRIPQPDSGAPPSALASGTRTAAASRRPGAHSRDSPAARPELPNRVTSRSEPSGQMSFVAAWGPITLPPARLGRSLSCRSSPALRVRLCSGLPALSVGRRLWLLPDS